MSTLPSLRHRSHERYAEEHHWNAASAKVAEYLRSLESSTKNAPSDSAEVTDITPEQAKLIQLAVPSCLYGVLECLKASGLSMDDIKGKNVGVYSSISGLFWDNDTQCDEGLEGKTSSENHFTTAPEKDMASTALDHIKKCYALSGPTFVFDHADRASLLPQATKDLKDRIVDMALIIGSKRIASGTNKDSPPVEGHPTGTDEATPPQVIGCMLLGHGQLSPDCESVFVEGGPTDDARARRIKLFLSGEHSMPVLKDIVGMLSHTVTQTNVGKIMSADTSGFERLHVLGASRLECKNRFNRNSSGVLNSRMPAKGRVSDEDLRCVRFVFIRFPTN